MKLSDQEILELNELCNAAVDGSITDAQRPRLANWLKTSEEARRFYIRATALSASLFEYASEMQAEEPDAVTQSSRVVRPAAWIWGLGSFAAAASVALLIWFGLGGRRDETATDAKAADFVARLSGSKDCQWIGKSSALQPGDQLRSGQRLELAAGLAEITFDCGAQVVLTGPATLELNSAWDAVLRRGALRANVPTEAIGFRISNPAVEVVDLGTEFSMVADEKGATEVFVLKGAVEAAPGDSVSKDRETIVLREKEARRFAVNGVSTVSNSEQKFARFTRPVTFDRLMKPAGYVRWSFDETDASVARAESAGFAAGSFDAKFEPSESAALAGAHVTGRWQRALNFDGHFSARAALPGVSASAARTVAFWMKVPENAQLSGGSAAVAWGMRAKKSAAPFVQIGWNRNPLQGTLGALRTEFGRGLAVGTTPLRDGRWHHVAIVFVPGDRAEAPAQVKQYVDGRLEESATKPDRKRRSVTAPTLDASDDAAKDIVWIGRRLGKTARHSERFRGALDELVIADRALAPHEIVQLMTENRLPQAELPAAAALLKNDAPAVAVR